MVASALTSFALVLATQRPQPESQSLQEGMRFLGSWSVAYSELDADFSLEQSAETGISWMRLRASSSQDGATITTIRTIAGNGRDVELFNATDQAHALESSIVIETGHNHI